MVLVPDLIRDLWSRCQVGELTAERFSNLEKAALDEYRMIWREALIQDSAMDLRQALLAELQEYLFDRPSEGREALPCGE